MRKRILIAFVLLIGAVLSGCLGTDADSENGEDNSPPGDHETHPKYLPPRVDGVELPNVTYPSFQVRDCKTLTAGLVLPRDSVEDAIPPEFETRSLFSPSTTGVSLRMEQCSDSLDNSSVFGKTHTYMALAEVQPMNESWSTSDAVDFYVLDIASDNTGWIKTLEEVHLHADESSFSFTIDSLIENMFLADVSIETNSWNFALEYKHVPNEPQNLDHEILLWYGNGPFHRLHEATSYVSTAYSAMGAGVFTHEGESNLSSILPTTTFPYHGGSWRADLNTLYQYDGAWEE